MNGMGWEKKGEEDAPPYLHPRPPPLTETWAHGQTLPSVGWREGLSPFSGKDSAWEPDPAC